MVTTLSKNDENQDVSTVTTTSTVTSATVPSSPTTTVTTATPLTLRKLAPLIVRNRRSATTTAPLSSLMRSSALMWTPLPNRDDFTCQTDYIKAVLTDALNTAQEDLSWNDDGDVEDYDDDDLLFFTHRQDRDNFRSQ